MTIKDRETVASEGVRGCCAASIPHTSTRSATSPPPTTSLPKPDLHLPPAADRPPPPPPTHRRHRRAPPTPSPPGDRRPDHHAAALPLPLPPRLGSPQHGPPSRPCRPPSTPSPPSRTSAAVARAALPRPLRLRRRHLLRLRRRRPHLPCHQSPLRRRCRRLEALIQLFGRRSKRGVRGISPVALPCLTEMDKNEDAVQVLTRRVEELQQERDELRKDIEQLCMQQSGPGYVSVATRMLSQRTSALEQDIENLQKKLSGCLRENQNLQEELSEAYRVKSQLAELHGAELSKNKDLEKQVRFFQTSVAQAFAERDNALMECEKAKEQEEAVLKKFADFEERSGAFSLFTMKMGSHMVASSLMGSVVCQMKEHHGLVRKEYQSVIDDQKHLSDALQKELTELKAQAESSMKVILKFYELRCRDSECPSNIAFEQKCSVLLDDCADNWSFSSDGGTSTLNASLEEEKESLKAKIAKLQSNLRMGLEIEQHLQRNARILEKRQAMYDDFLRNELSDIQKFFKYQRDEITKILEEESSQLSTVASDIQDMLSKICITTEISKNLVDEIQSCDSSCKDVHVTTDISPNSIASPKGDPPADSESMSFNESKALAQALHEKMEALMLLSQEQERYLLEKQRNQIVIEDLQKNLSQVRDEKVNALMELAKLKEEYMLLKGSSAVKEGHDTGDSLKVIPGHDQQGMLQSMLKRTSSLRHWMKKGSTNMEHGSSDGNYHTVCKDHSVDMARLKVENSTLLESFHTVERLTSSVHRLHIVLLKAYDDVKSAGSMEGAYEALNSLITEANLMKRALSVVLPVSWSGDSSDAITYQAMYESDSPKSKSEKVDPLSSAGMEMVELLIFGAEILKDSFSLKK
ncbi:hypothetical protein ACP4OV_010108 [Aristida adscensionis]